MKKRLIALTMALAMAASFSTACIGKFGLTGKVREWNLKQTEDRWGRWGIFIAMYIIPVYPFSGAIDLLILNSVEFWTGENPITNEPSITPGAASDDLGSTSFTTDEGIQVTMTHELDDTITAVLTSPEGDSRTLTISKNDQGLFFQDEQGNILIDSAASYVSPELGQIL